MDNIFSPFHKVNYNKLNTRQKENYNYAKCMSILADYGFTDCDRVHDKHRDIDLVAYHADGKNKLNIQLTGRLTYNSNYVGKDIWVVFNDKMSNKWYLYNHDEFFNTIIYNRPKIVETKHWSIKGRYTWAKIPVWIRDLLDEKYQL